MDTPTITSRTLSVVATRIAVVPSGGDWIEAL
jgi:hypothetical protein